MIRNVFWLLSVCMLVLALSISCDGGGGCGGADADGDGVTRAEGDCDDADPAVNPLRAETCNGKDDNCDGQIDEGCQWNKTFGGDDNDIFYDMIPGHDGGYVIAGHTRSFTAQNPARDDGWIMKIDENGNELWQRTYGGHENDWFHSITAGNDSGYVVAGVFTASMEDAPWSEAWVMKIDEKGHELWNRTFGGPQDDGAFSIIAGNDGGYIVAGGTSSFETGEVDPWVIKIDENGNELWNWTFGGAGHEWVEAMVRGHDGGYVIPGFTESDDAEIEDAWVTKIDEKGNAVWTRTFGGAGRDAAHSIIPDNKGGYVIAGWSDSDGREGEVSRAWVFKINENGDRIWNRTVDCLDAPTEHGCWALDIIKADTGGYVMVGGSALLNVNNGREAWISSLTEDGMVRWLRGFEATEELYSVITGNYGGYMAAGVAYIGLQWSNGWVVKTDDHGDAPDLP